MSEDGAPSDDESVSLLRDLCPDQSRGASEDTSNHSKDQRSVDKAVGEVDQVEAKIMQKLNLRWPHKINGRGETQLHTECKRGNIDAVKFLIQAGVNVNKEDYAGWTALHEACGFGHEAVVQELLKAGANINANGCDGVTPLHDAVSSGNVQLVKLLLLAGSNPETKTVGGLKAFDMAKEDKMKDLLSSFKQIQGMLSEIQSVLTEVLNKQRMEKEKLAHKYLKMSDSLRQRVLKGQLLSLASCQRKLMEVLVKHKGFVDSFSALNHQSVITVSQQAELDRNLTAATNLIGQQVFSSDRALSDSILSEKGEGNPPQTHTEDLASPQEELSTAEDVSLEGVSLEGVSLEDVSLVDESLVDESLEDVSLEDVSLVDESLVDESLEDVSLVDESLVDESLEDVSLVDESLVDVSLEDESLEGVSLEDESLEDVSLEDESLEDVLNIKFIHLVADEERLPNALMDIYWDRLLQKDSDDWGPF